MVTDLQDLTIGIMVVSVSLKVKASSAANVRNAPIEVPSRADRARDLLVTDPSVVLRIRIKTSSDVVLVVETTAVRVVEMVAVRVDVTLAVM